MNTPLGSLVIRGDVLVELHDREGALVYSEHSHNLVVNTGLKILAKMLDGTLTAAAAKLDKLRLGVGTASVAASDVNMNSGISADKTGLTPTASLADPFFTSVQATWGTGEANGSTIAEVGVFASSSGVDQGMFARYKLISPVVKTVENTLTITYKITVQAA